jgi:DNA-binding FadR family transcriptional regulator
MVPAPGTGAANPQATYFRQMTSALRNGDLDTARQAYASLVKNAPEGKTWDKDSDFAALGRALKSGDVDAAKQAITQMVRDARGGAHDGEPGTMPVPAPVNTSSTGGVAGGTLSVQA